MKNNAVHDLALLRSLIQKVMNFLANHYNYLPSKYVLCLGVEMATS